MATNRDPIPPRDEEPAPRDAGADPQPPPRPHPEPAEAPELLGERSDYPIPHGGE